MKFAIRPKNIPIGATQTIISNKKKAELRALMIMDFFSLIILNLFLTPVLAFTIYFCFLHSIRHSITLIFELDKSFKSGLKKFINKAIDVVTGKKNIFSVNPKYYNFYEKKYKSKDVSWLTVLASFHKEHLEYHGIKSKHIQSTEIDCINFKELIEQNDFQKLDLLVVDTEGYDDVLITNFIFY